MYLYTDIVSPELDLIAQEYGHHPSFLKIIPTLSEITFGADVKNQIEQNLSLADSEGFILNGFDDQFNAAELRQFCSALVPLAHFTKTDYTPADTLIVPVECFNALYGDIQTARASYYIFNDSLQIVAGGQLFQGGIPIGKNHQLGTVIVPLNNITKPQKLTLTVVFTGNKYVNHWDFWVRPPEEETSN